MREHLKKAKNYISNRLSISKAFQYRNRKRAVVLTYHLIYDKGACGSTRQICSISSAEFERHIEYLIRNYQIVPLREIVDDIRNGGTLPQRALAITFDDGFRNFYTVAYPILRSNRVPVTVFVSTGLIGSSELFWFDKVEQLILACDAKQLLIWLDGVPREVNIGRKDQTIWQIAEWLKKLPRCKIEEALRKLEVDLRISRSALSPPTDEYMPMSWEEVEELVKDENITFGSHTCYHSIVSHLSEDKLHEEIFGSKEMLEAKLGMPIEHFSYPNGQRCDFNLKAKNMLIRAGYKSALTTIEQCNSEKTDVFELRRFGASLTLEELIPRISGVDAFLVSKFGMLLGLKEGSFGGEIS